MAYVYHLQCSIDNLHKRIIDLEERSHGRHISTLKGLTSHTDQIRGVARMAHEDRMTRTVKDEIKNGKVTRRMTMLRKEED